MNSLFYLLLIFSIKSSVEEYYDALSLMETLIEDFSFKGTRAYQIISEPSHLMVKTNCDCLIIIMDICILPTSTY